MNLNPDEFPIHEPYLQNFSQYERIRNMIIDVHTHIGRVGEENRSPEDLINSMNEAQIDISFIISNSFDRNRELGATIEEVIDAANKYANRLKAIGNIDYTSLDNNQIDNILSLLERKLLIGLKFYTGYEHFFPHDKRLYLLYEHCSKNNIPVIFHNGVLLTGSSGLLKYSHPLTIDELAVAYPDLKIIIAHFGNPWIRDCAAVVAKNPNVYVDLSGYFTEFQSITNEEKNDFIKVLTEFKIFVGGFHKCMFGTDWPLYSQKEYLNIVRELSMNEEEKDLVFSKNALRIFNLE